MLSSNRWETKTNTLIHGYTYTTDSKQFPYLFIRHLSAWSFSRRHLSKINSSVEMKLKPQGHKASFLNHTPINNNFKILKLWYEFSEISKSYFFKTMVYLVILYDTLTHRCAAGQLLRNTSLLFTYVTWLHCKTTSGKMKKGRSYKYKWMKWL